MTNTSRASIWLSAALPWLGAASGALAQDDVDDVFDRTPRDCVVVSSIDDTEALDDQNIVFRMHGDKVYRNHLPRKCPGLERENRFMYETRGGRLCSIDTITVLEQFGVGFQRGFTCRLGEFVPLSEAEVEDIDLKKEGRPTQNVIETEEVDLKRTRRERAERDEPAPAQSEAADEQGLR